LTLPGFLFDWRLMVEFEIVVKFGKGIPQDAQGPVMLAMEKSLRESGYPVCVFKETMPDDSKLRRSMTPLERASL